VNNQPNIDKEENLELAEAELTDAEVQAVHGGALTLTRYNLATSLSVSRLRQLALIRDLGRINGISNKEWQE
jgi:hypothetical protein